MIIKDKIRQTDFSGGQANNLNITVAPQNTVDLGLNVDFDNEIGSAVSRLGTARIGSQLVSGNSILGLHQYTDAVTPANDKLYATINASGGATSVIYDVVAGSTSVTGLTASTKMRSLSFLGETLFINGADAERSYNGSAFITTGGAFDLANVPSSNKVNLCIEFLDRVYLSGDTAQPTRLYYSGLSSGTAVSWTSGNGNVDIENEDGGGPITALGKVPGYILVFKQRSLHRWNFSSAFPESLIQIGTPSQESVVMSGGLCAFYSNSSESARGFYITNGDRPICISQDNNRPIKKWVDAIASGSEANIAGWATDRHFCWSIGDVTVDDETYSNVVLRYNRLLNQWSVRTYLSEFKVFAQYLVSGVNTIVGGDDNGTIYRLDKTATYNDANTSTTVPIKWKVRQQHLTYGMNQKKSITDEVIVRGSNMNSPTISVILDEDLTNRIPIGQPSFWKKILAKFNVREKISGTTLSVEISGETNGAYAYIREIELPTMEVDQNYI